MGAGSRRALPRLVSKLATGGSLAVQMPDNQDERDSATA